MIWTYGQDEVAPMTSRSLILPGNNNRYDEAQSTCLSSLCCSEGMITIILSSHSDFPLFLLLCCWAHLLNSYSDYCIRPQNSRWFFFFPFFLKWESNCTTERYRSYTIMENCMRRKWKQRAPIPGVAKLKW